MRVVLLETSLHAQRPFPVEFAVSVDGKALRVTIDWRDVERLMGVASADEGSVWEFFHAHQREFALAVHAHLAARGVPLNRELALSAEDFAFARGTSRGVVDTMGANP